MVVAVMAGGALICLWAYRMCQQAGPANLNAALFSIQQQAGIVSALSTATYAVIAALQTGKPSPGPGALATVPGATSATTGQPTVFGMPATAPVSGVVATR